MVIQHNLQAMNTNRMLKGVGNRQGKLTEKLSSGFRINRAADDAAGLSISEKMRKQIRGLTQAAANAQDGISMMQTAEGALNEVHDMLHRLNELAIKNQNGTLSDSDRQAIQEETNALLEEIDRVSTTSKFNETYLFPKPAQGAVDIQTNPYKGKVYAAAIDYDGLLAGGAINNLEKADLEKIRDYIVDKVPNFVGGILEALPALKTPSITNMQIGLNFTNEPSGGYLAYVSSNGIKYNLTVNLHYLEKDNDSASVGFKAVKSQGGDIESFDSTLVHEMTHAIMFDQVTAGMLGTSSGVQGASRPVDSFPTWFIEGMAQTTGGGIDLCNSHGMYLLNNKDDAAKKNWLEGLNDPNDSYAPYAQGYMACLYLGHVASSAYKADPTVAIDPQVSADGLNEILKDIKNGYSLSESIEKQTGGKYKGLNDFTNRFSTDAVGYLTDFLAQTSRYSYNVGSIINTTFAGTADDFDQKTENNYFTVDHTKTVAENNNIKNPYTGGGATVGGADSTGALNNSAQASHTGGSKNGVGTSGLNIGQADTTFLQIGADGSLDNRISVSLFDISAEGLGLSGLKSIQQAPKVAADGIKILERPAVRTNMDMDIDAIGAAIQKVSEMRSYYGAIQNRLEHTINNLDNVVENTQAAESAIRDTDMASFMVQYSNNNILLQAGQSMLAQANQSNQGVLSLLG